MSGWAGQVGADMSSCHLVVGCSVSIMSLNLAAKGVQWSCNYIGKQAYSTLVILCR